MMTLDEAIKHAEEVANECTVYFQTSDNEVTQIPSQCAEEHRQLAEWLKELKRVREQPWLKELKELREQKRPHGDWGYDDRSGQFICSECEGGVDMPTLMGEPLYKWCSWCGADMRKSETKND